MCFVQIGKRRPIDVFVENKDIYIKGSVLIPEEIKITGSKSHDDLIYLQDEHHKLSARRNTVLLEIANAKKQGKNDLAKSLKTQYNSYPDSLITLTEEFISKNPNSIGAAYFICTLTGSFDINSLKKAISLFDNSIKESEYIEFLNDELTLNQKLQINSDAFNFEISTSTGEKVTLDDYSEKYLFIDFGASWCKDQKKRNIWLSDYYSKYKDEGFEILSISLDKNKEDWLNYLNKDSDRKSDVTGKKLTERCSRRGARTSHH